VMIEAMACGTPVIAYRGGAVPEITEQGHTGFVVEALEDAVTAVRRIPQLSRKRCREVFEKQFTAARMASDYVRVFERLIRRNKEKMPEAAGWRKRKSFVFGTNFTFVPHQPAWMSARGY